jgi:hypothetical protein
MSYISTSVDIDVQDVLDELDDDELIEELERRGLDMNTKYVDGDQMREWLTAIWLNRRHGKDYQRELDQLIYFGLGKIL